MTSNLPCREMAESGTEAEGLSLQRSGDDQLFAALVAGLRIAKAAEAAGLSERTAYRRLSDPEFKSQLDAARERVREATIATLTDAGQDAIATLRGLLLSDDTGVKLKAAKTLLDSLIAVSTARSAKREAESEEPRAQLVLVMPEHLSPQFYFCLDKSGEQV